MSELEKELENVLTIDGRGRPAKARLLSELIQKYGLEELMQALKKIGERKWF